VRTSANAKSVRINVDLNRLAAPTCKPNVQPTYWLAEGLTFDDFRAGDTIGSQGKQSPACMEADLKRVTRRYAVFLLAFCTTVFLFWLFGAEVFSLLLRKSDPTRRLNWRSLSVAVADLGSR